MKAVALAVALAVASTGCISYFAARKVKSEPVQSKVAVMMLVAEVAAGTAFGISTYVSQGNDDGAAGVAGYVAAGNVLMFGMDAAAALIYYAVKSGDD